MKKFISALCIILLILQTAVPYCILADKTDEASEKVTFDVYGLENDGIIRKYEETFDQADIRLFMQEKDMGYIPLLSDFNFNSLELVIEFQDEQSLLSMKSMKELIFPESLTEVEIVCGKEQKLADTDAMDNFIISLWACCPDAVLNGAQVSDLAGKLRRSDTSGMAQVYETNARMNILFRKAVNGELEVLPGEAEFVTGIVFMVYDDVSLCSQEAIAAKEPFYSVPSVYLADGYENANTAVFIFPVRSVIGTYANQGQAVCTYTRVCVVDLQLMKMYEIYTAVRNDPPEVLDIVSENGVYSEEGAQGAYEPKEALNQILTSGKIKEEKAGTKRDQVNVPAAQAANDSSDTVQEDKSSGTVLVISQADSAESSSDNNEKDKVKNSSLVDAQEVNNISKWLTQDTLDRIFGLLEDDTYEKTYNSLQKTKDLALGSKGELVKNLQQTLIECGQNIAADSNLGDATMTALNQVLTSFGVGKVSKISSKIFASLMPALLISKDEEAAKELFRDIFSDWESAYEYAYGSLMYSRGNFYKARKAFENSKCADYETRVQECVQDMPSTGQIYKDSAYVGKDASLTVQINGNDELAATCIMIYNENDELAAAMLVRGSGTAAAFLKEGKYRVLSGTGYRWYGLSDMFGEDGDYEEIIFDDGLNTLDMKNGYDYSIIYNSSEHNEAALNLGAEDVDWNNVR